MFHCSKQSIKIMFDCVERGCRSVILHMSIDVVATGKQTNFMLHKNSKKLVVNSLL